MNVPKLRKLLEDFGEKNQEHYNRLHYPPRDHTTMDDSDVATPSNPNDQPRVQNLQSQPRNGHVSVRHSNFDSAPSNLDDQLMAQNVQYEPRNDAATVFEVCPVTEDDDPIPPTKHHQTKGKISNDEDEKEASMTVLSASSFDGSYGVICKNRSSGEKTASTVVDSEVLLSGQHQSWDSDPPSVSSWWSEEDFSEASFEPKDTSKHTTESKVVSNIRGKTSFDGEFQVNRAASTGIQGFENNMGPDHVAIISRHTNPIPSADVNDASSLEESAGEEETSMHNASLFKNKILTSRTLDFLCDTKAASTPNPTASVASSEDTIDSRGGNNNINPSISEEVKSSKLGKLLLNLEEASEGMGELKITDAKKDASSVIPPAAVNKPPRRKLRDPKDLTFLQSKNPQPQGEAPRLRSSTSVRTGISRFGGAGRRKKLVERRKEELEREWGETKRATHIVKETWCVCKKTGTYKKKKVLDKQYE